MKAQIQQLIAAGKTEEALDLLSRYVDDAILLQAQFNAGKRQFNTGQIDNDDWQRIINGINFRAIEMAASVKDAAVVIPVSPSVAPVEPINAANTVFISYNHQDRSVAEKIQEFLTQKGITVAIDFQNMAVGQNIGTFILDQIKHNQAVLSLVSKNSLRSGWVGLESDLAQYSQLLNDKKFIPVMIDQGVFDGDFFFQIIEETDAKLKDLDGKIEKAKQLGIGYAQFETQRSRLHEQRNNLDKIFAHFQGVLIADISDGNFDSGMTSVVMALG
ncbi:MAG: toll/interleukin-1 receptor domain-containing protein [Lewinellaceae bacterium]|nr:toll/interleukin-1 receptor domain-containing protein [Lewinellaceae bacterium]